MTFTASRPREGAVYLVADFSIVSAPRAMFIDARKRAVVGLGRLEGTYVTETQAVRCVRLVAYCTFRKPLFDPVSV